MKTTVKMWGKSAAVRIPASVMRAARIHLGDVVDVRDDGCRITIERSPGKTYDLDDLVNGITPRNLHPAAEFGPPQGKEVW